LYTLECSKVAPTLWISDGFKVFYWEQAIRNLNWGKCQWKWFNTDYWRSFTKVEFQVVQNVKWKNIKWWLHCTLKWKMAHLFVSISLAFHMSEDRFIHNLYCMVFLHMVYLFNSFHLVHISCSDILSCHCYLTIPTVNKNSLIMQIV
jgi:hypothetical protein